MNDQSQRAAPDVLVVGAGPVGLTLACELQRRGTSCRIVDMNEGPAAWSKASVIHARTLEVFEDMGIADAVIDSGRKVHAVSFFSDGARVSHVSVDSIDSRFPFMLGLSQRETERHLERHLESLGGRVERRVELGELRHGTDGVEATLTHDGNRRETVKARWLVGCDGPGSTVRTQLGVPFEGSTYAEAVIQGDVRLRFPPPSSSTGRRFSEPDGEALFFTSPRGVIAALPFHADGRYRVLAILAPDERLDPTLPTFQKLMDERGPEGTLVSDPAWMVAFRVHQRMVPAYRKHNVFLAGDAAHVHSPVGGQGMNLGIQDAYNLGWKLALVAAGRAHRVILDSYEPERAPVAAATLGMTDAAMRAAIHVMGFDLPLARALRDQLIGLATRLPLVEDRIAGMLGGTSIDYRKSPIVAEDHPKPLWPGEGGRNREPPSIRTRESGGSLRVPAVGERLGDVALNDARGPFRRLFDLVRGPLSTLLLLAGPAATEADCPALALLAAEVRTFHGDAVRVHLIGPPNRAPACASAIPDESGVLHRKLGAHTPTACFVRPDGYVGYRCEPVESEKVLAYLESIFRG